METEKKNDVQLFSDELYSEVLGRAEKSSRKRMNYNFHASMEENPHRFLNVMLKGTYITPHRHLFPPKSESFILLKGKAAFFIFNEDGAVTQTFILSDEKGFMHGIDIAPGVWHTLAVLSESAVCFEVKAGPYQKTDDKEFPDWAPREGDPKCGQFLDNLISSL
ncbi:MAG: WbuC family cupin fold metalloprotein [Spirochaetia bacterium]|nr:WbuC family cupin fold metalloprotein [Spirochaetia bacterium]